MGTAEVQGQMWGVRARGGRGAGSHARASHDRLLRETAVGAGAAFLDIGCGSGMFCQLAARLGAQVSGLDAVSRCSPLPGERVPQGDFRTGEMGRVA